MNTHLIVEAEVRYWEDTTVNGVEDSDGSLVPLRKGKNWCPVIELATGKISDWPQGTVAEVHYKVCDQGEYWLANSTGSRVAKRKGHYVPDDLLCVGDRGYGDYIIFNVGADGTIAGWTPPTIDPSEWTPVPAPR